MGQRFAPYHAPLHTGGKVANSFDRILTPISVAVGFAGAVLVLLGPVRILLSGHPATEAVEASNPPVAEISSISTDAAWSGEEIDRGLVPYTIIPDRPRDRVITYTVQRGDTLMGIADTFHLNRNTLFWANPGVLQDVHFLSPGMDLYILPVDGVYHKSDGGHTLQWIADKYGVDVSVILNSEYNDLAGYTPDSVPPWGMRIVVPGGTGEFPDWTPPIVETVDQNTGVISRSFMPNMPGSCPAGIAGYGGTGAWIPPLASYTVTRPFHEWHSGIDLAAPLGTPVTAADSGVVVFSGWVPREWGYGILVVLDHGNGWMTYYAHLNTNGVRCGEFVPRGGYIGQVGSTGRSDGYHLHFEMRWGYTPDNPALYISF